MGWGFFYLIFECRTKTTTNKWLKEWQQLFLTKQRGLKRRYMKILDSCEFLLERYSFSINWLDFFLLIFFLKRWCIQGKGRATKMEGEARVRDILHIGSLPRWMPWCRLSQSEAKSQQLLTNLPHRWQGSNLCCFWILAGSCIRSGTARTWSSAHLLHLRSHFLHFHLFICLDTLYR